MMMLLSFAWGIMTLMVCIWIYLSHQLFVYFAIHATGIVLMWVGVAVCTIGIALITTGTYNYLRNMENDDD